MYAEARSSYAYELAYGYIMDAVDQHADADREEALRTAACQYARDWLTAVRQAVADHRIEPID